MNGPDRTTDGERGASVWVDEAPVDPAWAAPRDPDEQPAGRNRRRVLAIGIPILAVLVLIGTVFALGGFRGRDDTVTDVARGHSFTNGPYDLTFSSATVQQATGYGKYKTIQKVVVTGTVRNNGDKAMSPSSDWFLADGISHGGVQTAENAAIGDPKLFDRPMDVAPGLPPVRIDVEFDFPPTFKDTELVFAMRRVTYGTHSYLTGAAVGDSYWDASGSDLFRLRLHLTRIAPEDY